MQGREQSMEPENKKNKREGYRGGETGQDGRTKPKAQRWRIVLLVVFLCGAVIAGTVWAVQSVQKHRAEAALRELAAGTELSGEGQTPPDETLSGAEMDTETAQEPVDPIEQLREAGVPIPDKEVDLDALRAEVNEDIYAWIYLPDSQIDYPVLQHPTDNTYYLNYNLDGSKGYPGCIYTENYNAKDFSDPNTVLYGHNMKNGSMFAGLHKFEDSEYFEAHPYVYIYTDEGLLAYEIFAAHEAGNEHILFSTDFTDEREYENYLNGIFQSRGMNDNFRTELEVGTDDRILTLSTCVAGQSSKRYLVQGVLLNED